MLENLCGNKRKNKSTKLSENQNAWSILRKAVKIVENNLLLLQVLLLWKNSRRSLLEYMLLFKEQISHK
jgi:hypothetical protein